MGYKYEINHEYFNKIDTEYKAYILGFIYADGSIIQPKGNKQKRITISIQNDDGYILDKLAKEAGGSNDTFYPPSIENKGWKKRRVVSIVSDKICDNLIQLGCNINKSKIGMKFPNISNELIPHFIRGFMDGDGSIIMKKVKYSYIRKTSNIRNSNHIQRYLLRLAFTSTDKEFLEKLESFLSISKSYYHMKLRTQEVYTLWIEREKDVKNTVDYLYKNANFYLKRKYNKILEFEKTIKSQAEDISSEGLTTT